MSEPTEHIARFLKLKKLLQEEIELMEQHGHIKDGAIFVRAGELEDCIERLNQALKNHIE